MLDPEEVEDELVEEVEEVLELEEVEDELVEEDELATELHTALLQELHLTISLAGVLS